MFTEAAPEDEDNQQMNHNKSQGWYDYGHGKPEPEEFPELPKKPSTMTTLVLLCSFGLFLLCMLILTPVQDCFRLLWSSVYVYFCGRDQPFRIILGCVIMLSIYSLASWGSARHAAKDTRVDQVFMWLFLCSLLGLGIGFLITAEPLQARAQRAHWQLMYQCRSGSQTADLYYYYMTLLDIRKKPDCIHEDSVEKCPFYEERFPYTGFLKHLELDLHCSGFCYQDPPVRVQKFKAVKIKRIIIKRIIVRRIIHRIVHHRGFHFPGMPGWNPKALLETSAATNASDMDGVKTSLAEAFERRSAERAERSNQDKGLSLLGTDATNEADAIGGADSAGGDMYESDATHGAYDDAAAADLDNDHEYDYEYIDADTGEKVNANMTDHDTQYEFVAEGSDAKYDGTFPSMSKHLLPAFNTTMMDKKQDYSLQGSGWPFSGPKVYEETETPLWDEDLDGLYGNTTHNMFPSGWQHQYPPTLFTIANFKQTCEGAAARELDWLVVQTGNMIYLEGIALFLTASLLGFLRIMSMCRRTENMGMNIAELEAKLAAEAAGAK
jgi:hypothetical protein